MIPLANIQLPDLIYRLGWAVVHSLWLGLLIALVLATATRLMSKRLPGIGYAVSCMALAAILVAGITAFVVSKGLSGDATFRSTSPPGSSPRPLSGTRGIRRPTQEEPARLPTLQVLADKTVSALQPAIPYVAGTWIVGVVLVSLLRVRQWRAVRRILRFSTACNDLDLRAAVDRLAAAMGIRRALKVLVCRCVKVPAVIGWMRPVLLLPLSFGTGLAPQQIEAILAHELAHVRRLDYLVNVLQTVVETLLFFHPAVWYISRRIRHERERSCDAAAVSVCGDPEGYAEALAATARLSVPAGPAIAIDGGVLLPRIRHILGLTAPASIRSALVPGLMTLVLAAVVGAVGFGPPVVAAAYPVPVRRVVKEYRRLVKGSDEEAIIIRLPRILRQRMPSGWVVARIQMGGKERVWNWDPPEGECYVVGLAVREPSRVGPGKPLQIFIWLMHEDYKGRPVGDGSNWRNVTPREIGRWRGRRVLLWGDGRYAGWPSYEADILEALKETDAMPSGQPEL